MATLARKITSETALFLHPQNHLGWQCWGQQIRAGLGEPGVIGKTGVGIAQLAQCTRWTGTPTKTPEAVASCGGIKINMAPRTTVAGATEGKGNAQSPSQIGQTITKQRSPGAFLPPNPNPMLLNLHINKGLKEVGHLGTVPAWGALRAQIQL